MTVTGAANLQLHARTKNNHKRSMESGANEEDDEDETESSLHGLLDDDYEAAADVKGEARSQLLLSNLLPEKGARFG